MAQREIHICTSLGYYLLLDVILAWCERLVLDFAFKKGYYKKTWNKMKVKVCFSSVYLNRVDLQ